jgi:hypothetical protein
MIILMRRNSDFLFMLREGWGHMKQIIQKLSKAQYQRPHLAIKATRANLVRHRAEPTHPLTWQCIHDFFLISCVKTSLVL